MTDFRAMIFAKARKIIPGIPYNRFLQELAEAGSDPGSPMMPYEVILPAEGSWEHFRDHAYPPFVRYLKDKSIDPEDPRGVTVAVFFQERCYLLDGRAFLDVLREMEGLNTAALHFRVLQWLTADVA
jgi:hypothetical protein